MFTIESMKTVHISHTVMISSANEKTLLLVHTVPGCYTL